MWFEFDHERLQKKDWVVESVEVTWLDDTRFALATIYGPLPLRVGDKVFVDEEDRDVAEEDWDRHYGKIKEVRQSPECKKVLLHLQHPHPHLPDMEHSLCKVTSDWHGTNFDIQRHNLFKLHEEKGCMSAEMVVALLEKSLSPEEVERREFRGESQRSINDMLKGYKLPSTVEWSKLNFSQKKVVAAALRGQRSLGGSVTLIKGPPGTGKTRTGVCAVLAMASKLVRGEKILVTGLTNNCVDNFAKQLVGLVTLVRVYSRAQVDEDEIDRVLLPYALHKMPKHKREAALANAQVVCCTLITAGCKDLQRAVFKNVIIEEAAQATVPEVVVCLTHRCQNLVMIGDSKQMQPQVHSQQALDGGLNISLFQRLSERGGFPTLLLNVQYRMHPALSRWPMQRFYRGMVGDGVKRHERRLGRKDLPFPNPRLPKVMLDVSGEEAEVWTSFKNEAEADMVLHVVQKFQEWGVQPERICVITPYDGQQGRLKMKMEDHNLSCEVSTIDGFQGQERDVVILSTVRTRQLGFLNDRRRLNVAVTRAKFALVVVGNTDLLRTDRYWNSMIEHYQAQGCFVQVILSNYIRGE